MREVNRRTHVGARWSYRGIICNLLNLRLAKRDNPDAYDRVSTTPRSPLSPFVLMLMSTKVYTSIVLHEIVARGTEFRMARTTRRSLSLLLMILTACRPADETPSLLPLSQVRDSAGVQLVETRMAGSSATEQWIVEEAAVLEIGTVSGERAYEFGTIRDALRLRDGRFAVLDGRSDEIRLFGPTGRFLKVTGATGDGPGEFRDPIAVHVYRTDSLAVWDHWLRRVSIFDDDLVFARSFVIDPPSPVPDGWTGRGPAFLGVFSDGSLVVGHPVLRWDLVGTVQAEVGPVIRLLPDGAPADTLGHFMFKQWYLASETPEVSLPAFPHWTFFAVRKESLYVARANAYEVQVYGTNGGLELVLRRAEPPRKVAVEDVEFWKRYRLDRLPSGTDAGSVNRLEAQLDAMPFPEYMPTHWNLLIDELGHIWVEEFAARPNTPPAWSVFDPDGRWVSTVRPPPNLEIKQIGSDYLLGVVTDELGIQYVRVHRLRKG